VENSFTLSLFFSANSKNNPFAFGSLPKAKFNSFASQPREPRYRPEADDLSFILSAKNLRSIDPSSTRG
jgi:hypothetical protein